MNPCAFLGGVERVFETEALSLELAHQNAIGVRARLFHLDLAIDLAMLTGQRPDAGSERFGG